MVKAADTPCPGNKGAMRCASVRFGAGGEDVEAEAEVGGDLPFYLVLANFIGFGPVDG